MSNSKPEHFPKAFKLVNNGEQTMLSLNTTELQTLLDKVEDKKVAILSVSGATGSGKGLLLNLLVDYLNWCASGSEGQWPDPGRKLKYFDWKSGSRGSTKGIYMWNKPFILKHKTGEEFALLLMDTEGIDDISGSEQEVPPIFALSTFISSLQLFNLKEKITSKDLENFRFFAQCTRATEMRTARIFQELRFLIRDWDDTSVYPNGSSGGQKFLNEYLVSSMPSSANSTSLTSIFETISCFLLYSPGTDLVRDGNMGNTIGEMDIRTKFLDNVRELFDDLKTAIPLKKVGGAEIKGSNLLVLIQNYFGSVKNGITLDSVKEAYAENLLNVASVSGQDHFLEQMNQFKEEHPTYTNGPLLDEHYQRSKEEALNIFDDFPKLDDETRTSRIRAKLVQSIMKQRRELFRQDIARNNNEESRLNTEVGNTRGRALGTITLQKGAGGLIAALAVGIIAYFVLHKSK